MRDLAKRVQVQPGCARNVRVSLCYVSPDHRAVLYEIDTCTKYLDVYHSMGFARGGRSSRLESVTAYLALREETLRPSRPKRPCEVRMPLPAVRGYWFAEVAASKYGAFVYAICPEPRL
jgi:hypothetical protein